jgi:hypothetical protein
MALPVEGTPYPDQTVSRKEIERWADLYAGRTIGKQDVLDPDPDLADSGSEGNTERRRVRGGLAADIGQTAANLVIGKQVGYEFSPEHTELAETVADETDAEWERVATKNGFARLLTEIFEISSVFGGAYVRAVANPDNLDVPYGTVIDPTRVQPVFVDGFLKAATLYTEMKIEGMHVWRYVEDRNNRTKTIDAALYRGTVANIGDKVSMDALEETQGLPEHEVYPDGVEEMVFYFPNLYPNRRRPGSFHGRSDLQNIESLCQAVDIALTALMQDIRLGRTIMTIPDTMLMYGSEEGSGASFNRNRELYTTLDIPPDNPNAKIELFQGTIRTTEFIDAILQYIERAVTLAGFSPQTFGLHIDGSAPSGVALKIRESKTISTTENKRLNAEAPLVALVETFLKLNVAIFGWTGAPARPRITWAPVRDDDPLAVAQTVETLMRAKAISIEQAVRMARPDLSENDVNAEVDKIMIEAGLKVDASMSDMPSDTQFNDMQSQGYDPFA